VNVVLGMRKASLVQIVTTRTPFSSKKLRNSRRVASVQPRFVVVPSAVQPSGLRWAHTIMAACDTIVLLCHRPLKSINSHPYRPLLTATMV
jgi:hypothetical protein